MKQTQADFDRGYQKALEDLKKLKEKNPDRAIEDILFELRYGATPVFVSKGRWKVINSKYALGYNKALQDKENEKQ